MNGEQQDKRERRIIKTQEASQIKAIFWRKGIKDYEKKRGFSEP